MDFMGRERSGKMLIMLIMMEYICRLGKEISWNIFPGTFLNVFKAAC